MHEQSETIQNKQGKWINVYGRNVADEASRGNPLPVLYTFEKPEYDTVQEAEKAAAKRSKTYNKPIEEQIKHLRRDRIK